MSGATAQVRGRDLSTAACCRRAAGAAATAASRP